MTSPASLRPLLIGIAALLLALLQTAPASAQFRRPPYPVKATAEFVPPSAKPGDRVRLNVTAALDPEYHIYGMYLSGSGPIPSTITEVDLPGWLAPVGAWAEPKPVVKFDKGFETNLELHYAPSVTFSREFTIGDAPTTDTLALRVDFLHQACRETNCLPPRTLKMTATLAIDRSSMGSAPTTSSAPTPTPLAGASPALPAGNTTGATQAAPAATTTPTEGTASAPGNVTEQRLSRAGFFGFLVICFSFGLLALVTPCVFPMVPITVSFFTKHAAKSRRETIGLAATYAGTIIGAFAVLGFGLALLLRALGAGEQGSGLITKVASDPWVNLTLAAVFIAFALSLFGMFDISLPSFITNRLGQAKGNRKDKLGAMFMALIFVVVSFTCTGPILGLLIVNAVGGEWFRPLAGMLVFAVGFALPFFVLALVPGWMQSMPKAGGWLNSTKIVMGLLELAAAFKFVSNADLVWKWGFFTAPVLLSLWIAISAVITFYLFNKIHFEHDDPPGPVGPIRALVGLAFGTLTLVMVGGLAGQRLPGFIDSYLPPDISGSSGSVASSVSSAAMEHPTFDTYEAGLAEARRTGKPLFVDFTGYTCTNCRLMEKNVFPKPEVDRELREFVFVKLWTDDEQVGEQHQEFQATRYGTIALPTYVVVDPRDEKTIGIIGYEPDAERFSAFLRDSRAAIASRQPGTGS